MAATHNMSSGSFQFKSRVQGRYNYQVTRDPQFGNANPGRQGMQEIKI